MARYYVNRNAQPNGDHEVHKQGCSYMPADENRINLGEHTTCHTAVAKAKREHFAKSNGCYYCSNECHTT